MTSFNDLEAFKPNITPGRNERRGGVFHHRILSFAETITFMSETANEVSYHCVLDTDGTRCRLAVDDSIAHPVIFESRTVVGPEKILS